MSRAIWKEVPSEELVKRLSTSAYLMYNRRDPDFGRIVVYQNQVTGKYKIAYFRDPTFILAEGLTSIEEVNEYFMN